MYLDIAKKVTTGGNTGASHADQAWDEFLRNAVLTPTGGLRDPGLCSAELTRQIREGGIPFETAEKSEIEYASIGLGLKS